MYIKVIKNDELSDLQCLDPVVYVYVNPANGQVQRCVEPIARGVVSEDGSELYTLAGKAPLPTAAGTAEKITEAEYLAGNQELGVKR